MKSAEMAKESTVMQFADKYFLLHLSNKGHKCQHATASASSVTTAKNSGIWPTALLLKAAK